jgi:hypothetical protein
VNKRNQSKKKRLVGLNSQIKSNIGGFLIIGRALRSIKDNELYALDGYSSFDEYCSVQWDLSPNKTSYYIRLAESYENIKASADGKKIVLPINEFQLGHIVRLPKDKQIIAWHEVLTIVRYYVRWLTLICYKRTKLIRRLTIYGVIDVALLRHIIEPKAEEKRYSGPPLVCQSPYDAASHL